MYLTKLNQTGIAHYLVPIIVVVLVALGGVALMVASHADSTSAPKLKKISYKTKSTVKGHAVGNKWCAPITMKFKVQTTGTVDSVLIARDGYNYKTKNFNNTAGGVYDEITHLQYKSKKWTGQVTLPNVCVESKGQKINLQGSLSGNSTNGGPEVYQQLRVYAIYGDNVDISGVTRPTPTIPNKKVKID